MLHGKIFGKEFRPANRGPFERIVTVPNLGNGHDCNSGMRFNDGCFPSAVSRDGDLGAGISSIMYGTKVRSESEMELSDSRRLPLAGRVSSVSDGTHLITGVDDTRAGEIDCNDVCGLSS